MTKKHPLKKDSDAILIPPPGYDKILADLKDLIKTSQFKAISAVNQALIFTYRGIGQTIHEQQQSAGWGTSVVEKLAKDLQNAFPGMKGFSARNLWNMRDFHLSYEKDTKLQTLSAEISWSHNIAILGKCKDILEKEFYMRMSKRNRWTHKVLLNQIDNKNYEKTMTSQTNFDKSLPEKIRPEAKLSVKDEYIFNFIELGEEHSEYELERAIVNNIETFLREVGSAYAFMGSQYKLEVGDQEFIIDILLFNRKLKAIVAIELKIGKFIPEYVGKMQFYLSVLNDKVRFEGENPPIGIILCKEKNRTVVEYALKEANQPIGVVSYKTVSDLPKELKHELPSPDQIALLLKYLEAQ